MTSDRWTQAQLDELEERIKKEYKTAYIEVKQTASAYFATLQDRIDKEEEAWKAGRYTDDQFKAWKQAQIARGQRWEAVRDDLANRITTANQAAAAYINDTTPGIYALNHNYESYLIDQAEPISWTLYDENTIKRLMYDENHSEFRTVSINPVRDYNWNREQIQTAITSGILQGKSMQQMADAFLGVMGRNQTAAIRNARTAVTSAQNGGRQDCYEKAQAAGIELKKEWIATLDDRTRASHGDLDGERVEVDEPFSNGLMYPGDPDGAPAEVYNCRCTTRAVLPGITDGKTRQTYDEWLNEHGYYGETPQSYGTNKVNWEYIKSKEYKEKFDKISDNKELNNAIYEAAIKSLQYNDGKYMESLYIFNKDGTIFEHTEGVIINETYNPKELTEKVTSQKPYSLVALHNHATNNPPSGSDFTSAGYKKYDFGIVACHDGAVYKYTSKNAKSFMYTLVDLKVEKFKRMPYNKNSREAGEMALKDIAEFYGIEWSELQ